MCQQIPPPPPDVEAELPEPGANDEPMTKRDQLEQHREDPTCAGCHNFTDPIGLALENFDALGGYRETDQGLTIDPSGQLDGEPFADASELGQRLADNPAVIDCMSRNLYRYAVGHVEQPEEADVIAFMNETFEQSGYDLQAVIEALATDQAFRVGTLPSEEPE
jgi:hypothetical protein